MSTNTNTNTNIDRYLQSLVNRWFIFDKRAELHEGNTIYDIDIVKSCVTLPKKITDTSMIDLTRCILETFACFPISIDIQLKDQIDVNQSESVYIHYKRYKNSVTSTQQTETTLDRNDQCDTSATEYISSLEKVTTKNLRHVFGEPLRSGGPQDNYRYEYRLNFTTDHVVYIFSLYDYRNTKDTFHDLENVYWHVASDTKRKDVHTAFNKHLLHSLQLACNSSEDCC